jgi:hypothetical protein
MNYLSPIPRESLVGGVHAATLIVLPTRYAISGPTRCGVGRD